MEVQPNKLLDMTFDILDLRFYGLVECTMFFVLYDDVVTSTFQWRYSRDLTSDNIFSYTQIISGIVKEFIKSGW